MYWYVPVFYSSGTQHENCGLILVIKVYTTAVVPGKFFFFFFFPMPFIMFALLFSLPPSRSSDPGSHSRLFPPLPTTVRALHFYRAKISALSSLVRYTSTHHTYTYTWYVCNCNL